MKKIIAFGGSSSRKSINRKFANYIAGKIKNVEIKLLDLNDFEMPIFSVDRQNESGIHELAYKFKKEIIDADGIVISLAEHNGAYSAAFKNIYDWVSRIGPDVWEGKPMIVAATSTGSRGGQSVLKIAVDRFKRKNPNKIITFSLPEFGNNFSEEKGILVDSLELALKAKVEEFENIL